MKADTPSATAYLIATSTLFVAADPAAGRLIPSHAVELSASFVGARSRVARYVQSALNRKGVRPFVSALERLTIPGIQLHYALRKLYLEETLRAALSGSDDDGSDADDSIRQVVIFGAGYDTLALRLHETFPGVQFIETDHPATQRRKTHALADARSVLRRERSPQQHMPRNLHFLPVDLTRQQLADTLANCPVYRTDARTLFIAEGLLMYLSHAEVDKLFQTIRARSGASSRIAFTFMEPQANGHVNFRTRSRAVDAWLSWRGEVFKWGIERDALPMYLRERGFNLREMATDETFRQRYLEPNSLAHLPLAAGEYVCIADLAEKDV